MGQYAAAARAGAAVGQALAGQVSGVGHSLGGGLDTVAALRGGYHGVNFNAVGVNPLTAYWNIINLNNANSLITSYSVPKDPLSQWLNDQWYAPGTDGRQVLLPSPDSVPLLLNRHSMANIISSIQRLLAQNGCNL
jgi:hypothetical protein